MSAEPTHCWDTLLAADRLPGLLPAAVFHDEGSADILN
jgi:hypothetical protein